MSNNKSLYVQYGCGLSCPEGWVNFDSSPTLRLQRLPLVGKVFRRPPVIFPDGVRVGDIVGGLPIEDNSVSGVYASHVLEHLSRDNFVVALANTFRMLKPGGIFRLIVPDLEARARLYLQRQDDPLANDWFMEASHLGVSQRTQGLTSWLRDLLGLSKHLWMWDERSIRKLLDQQGFIEIRRCQFNDSADPIFRAVEDRARFYDDYLGVEECAMEAVKPATKV